MTKKTTTPASRRRPISPGAFNIEKELDALSDMCVGELHDRYVEVFSEPCRSRHRQYLIRRIAWRLQANVEGGLSERAQRRAEELAGNADVRVTPPRSTRPKPSATGTTRSAHVAAPFDPRLPPVGADIVRDYKGKRLHVTVRADGFEYLGDRFKSLSAVAKAISGSHCNGFRFFGLDQT